MKKILFLLMMVFSIPALADDHSVLGAVIGGVAGGAVGNQIGNGRGRQLATAAGIAAGTYYGSRMGAESPEETIAARQASQRNQFNEQYNRSGYGSVTYSGGGYSASVGGYPGGYTVSNPVYARRASVPVDPCGEEQYYDGEFNPGAARAYCQGRQQYLRQMQQAQAREAFQRGANGE